MGRQTGKYRVDSCAVIAMAAWFRFEHRRIFCHPLWRVMVAAAASWLARTYLNGAITSALMPFAWTVTVMCSVAAFAWFAGGYQHFKLLDRCTSKQASVP